MMTMDPRYQYQGTGNIGSFGGEEGGLGMVISGCISCLLGGGAAQRRNPQNPDLKPAPLTSLCPPPHTSVSEEVKE